MATGVGIAPSPPQAGVIRELLIERRASDSRAAMAAAIAPQLVLSPSEGHAGTYAVDTGYSGLDLSRDPSALSPVSLAATNYLDEELSYGSRPFALQRYQVGRFDLPRRQLENLQATSGIDAERAIANKFADKAAAMYYQQVIAQLNTATLPSGHSYDPGNLTTSTYDLAGQLETVIGLFANAQIDLPSVDLILVAAPLVVAAMRGLDQVRASALLDSPNTNYSTDQLLEQWLAHYTGARSVRVMVDRPRYRDASGTPVNGLTAASCVFLVAAGGRERSFLKTIVSPEEAQSAFELRPEDVPAMPGTRWYCDMYHDVNLVDPSAAVRWTGALS